MSLESLEFLESLEPLGPTLLTLLGELKEGVVLLNGEGEILTANPQASALWPQVDGAQTWEDLGLPGRREALPGLTISLPGDVELRVRALSEAVMGVFFSPKAPAPPESSREAGALGLFSSLLHDLRNPMAGVPMLVQAYEFEREHLERDGGSHDVCFNYMSRISSEVRRMVRFLDFTRNLATPWLRAQGPVSGRAVIKSALERDRLTLERLGIGVDITPGGGHFFEADPQGARQAYSNLLGVALMRQSAGGEPIMCGERVEGESLCLLVSARGGGFAVARWPDVLQEPAPSPQRLTGLELALFTVRYLGEASGGVLEMSRCDLGRVEARLRFPLVGGGAP